MEDLGLCFKDDCLGLFSPWFSNWFALVFTLVSPKAKAELWFNFKLEKTWGCSKASSFEVLLPSVFTCVPPCSFLYDSVHVRYASVVYEKTVAVRSFLEFILFVFYRLTTAPVFLTVVVVVRAFSFLYVSCLLNSNVLLFYLIS